MIFARKKSTRIKDSLTDRVFLFVVHVILIACLLPVLYPLVYVVSASFSDTKAVVSGEVWLWPVRPTLRGYKAVFENNQIVSGFINSFIYMIFGTVISLFFSILAAYPLTRREFIGRNAVMGLYLFTMLFSGGMIPSYLLLKNLHMLDTRWALLIPGAVSVWNLIMMKTFYQSTLPEAMYEAANLDGCDDFQYLLHIVMPLSGPIIAIMALYYGVGQWNSYFNAMIYLKTQSLFPLQIILRNILVLNKFDPQMMARYSNLERMQGLAQLLKYSVIVVSSLPLMIMYPFVQKYFVKGVMIGAVKG